MDPLGQRVRVIPEGHIPSGGHGGTRALESHETICMLNTSDRDARVAITVYFSDREPAGPYNVTVPARRTVHQRFDDLTDPETLPRDTDFASVATSDVPIVAQHTRLDSRQAELALLSTIAWAAR
ncbi:sensory rhodopsin transducer [Glycomyces tarimensis]